MNAGLVFTVGNEMMGDDAAGPLLARMLEHAPLEKWQVLDGGNAPENSLFKIREIAPEQVVIVDSADMQLPAGEVRRIDQDAIGSLFLMTTHALPLSYFMEAIREFVPQVELIGIQPEVVAFGYPVSRPVRRAVRQIYDWLKDGEQAGAAGAIVNVVPGQGGRADEIDCSAQDQIR